MLPLTLLATNKFLNLLTTNDALSRAINSNAAAAVVTVAPLNNSQIMASSAGPDMGDLDLQLSYPRVCVYVTQVVNNQREKFRTFSGIVAVTADIWASDSLGSKRSWNCNFTRKALRGF